MSSVSKPRVRHNRHKQGLNLTLEKLSADFRYYTFDDNRNLIPVEDNWNIFNPLKCQWLPKDFVTQNYPAYLYDGGDDNYYRGNEWTDEDAWDAMTDGMYGDYPGSGWDPELFGF